ncbi:MAG: heavy metal translocating P-type ATPase [Planctomycetaceae bacterium]
MSGFASPAAARVQRSIESPLSAAERLRIGFTLGGGLLAGALFGVGVLLEKWGPPERRLIGVLCEAVAAVIVVAPLAWYALLGLLKQEPSEQVEQLVAIASLSALAIGDFYTATLIPLITHLGHFLEERSVLGAQAAAAGLRSLERQHACRWREGHEEVVPASSLEVGDVVVVRPGDVLPVDGLVCDGYSTIDQSSISGESLPVDVESGASVFAGTTNLSGLLRIEATRLGDDTALGRVVSLLQEAEQSKTPVLRLIEQYAGLFLLVVLSVAGVVLFLTRDIYRAIAVLVVGCPGPFILAGPSAMVAALSVATRRGVLIKNAKFLESLADVDTVVFDKTGTVTLGELCVVGCQPTNGRDDSVVATVAACCARASRHPVSRAIVNWSELLGIASNGTNGSISERPGLGVCQVENGSTRYMGRRAWLETEGFDIPADPEHGGSIVWVGCRHQGEDGSRDVLGAILLSDRPRPEAESGLAALRRLSIDRCVLLTGDRREVADQVASALQLDDVIAEVLPEQKLEVVRREKAAGNTVAVVGDGINDSLALAGGDVGIAMGALGSDIAIQSADIVLTNSDLTRIPFAVQLSRKTRRTIHQNVLVGGAITIGMLAIATAGWISPMAGAVLHNIGEVFVLMNSARLLRVEDNLP